MLPVKPALSPENRARVTLIWAAREFPGMAPHCGSGRGQSTIRLARTRPPR